MKRYFAVLLVIMAAGLMFGCQSTKYTHGVVETPQIDGANPYVLVVYGDEALREFVVVLRTNVDFSGKFPTCVLTIQNLSEYAIPIEYQFQWLDAAGMPLHNTPAWFPTSLSPNQVKTVNSTAKSTNAAKVEFMIRAPHTSLEHLCIEQQ